MKKKISVLLLSHNKPTFVVQAIKSVLNQTFTNFELLIIENSTDGITPNIVKEFNDPRIRYFEEKLDDSFRENIYVEPWLRNKYYQRVDGDYIIFLADDDLLIPTCLEESIRFIDKANCKVAYFGQFIQYLNSAGNKFDTLVRDPGIVLEKNKINPKELLDGGQVIFATQLLKKIPQPYLPTDKTVAEICDRIFLEKLWKIESFFPLGKILGIKRVTSISTHNLNRPFKYHLYAWLTFNLPFSLRTFLGRKTGKRRPMTKEEQSQLTSLRSQLNL